MSSTNRFRKYESGYQKRKKKQIIELTRSQKGAMDRFIIKESNVLSGNEALDQGPVHLIVILKMILEMVRQAQKIMLRFSKFLLITQMLKRLMMVR